MHNGVASESVGIFRKFCIAGNFDYGYQFEVPLTVEDTTDDLILWALGHNGNPFDLTEEVWRDAIEEARYNRGKIRRIFPVNLLNPSHGPIVEELLKIATAAERLAGGKTILTLSQDDIVMADTISVVRDAALDAVGLEWLDRFDPCGGGPGQM